LITSVPGRGTSGIVVFMSGTNGRLMTNLKNEVTHSFIKAKKDLDIVFIAERLKFYHQIL
jgi:hypothetical protein